MWAPTRTHQYLPLIPQTAMQRIDHHRSSSCRLWWTIDNAFLESGKCIDCACRRRAIQALKVQHWTGGSELQKYSAVILTCPSSIDDNNGHPIGMTLSLGLHNRLRCLSNLFLMYQCIYNCIHPVVPTTAITPSPSISIRDRQSNRPTSHPELHT